MRPNETVERLDASRQEATIRLEQRTKEEGRNHACTVDKLTSGHCESLESLRNKLNWLSRRTRIEWQRKKRQTIASYNESMSLFIWLGNRWDATAHTRLSR